MSAVGINPLHDVTEGVPEIIVSSIMELSLPFRCRTADNRYELAQSYSKSVDVTG